MACADHVTTITAAGPQAWLIDNGARLHLQHGPIDLIIHATGEHSHVRRAYKQAVVAFELILDTLAAQLPDLRRPLTESGQTPFYGAVAQRMVVATNPYINYSVTPMIAVAGAVADHVLSHMLRGGQLERVLVNNGGDIALYLTEASVARVGICTHPLNGTHSDIITVRKSHGIGGIATSGWRGRSHSLGIADAVTVLAKDAASADVAATLIANAVDLPGCTLIERVPACELAPDSDLLDKLVTVQVERLSPSQITKALNAGTDRAEHFINEGLLQCAYVHLQGRTTLAGVDPRTSTQPVSQAS